MFPSNDAPVDFEPDELSRFAVVEGDAVTNIIMAPQDYADPLGRELVPAPQGTGPEIGWARVSGNWINPDEPEAGDET